mmetsp:Transcript_128542/g.344865  ORF Transcript_128542/g.344865 Transcript_128542/m.344865 type:complete len:263 (+) Transcript_128542:827-1615(+)
MVPRSTGSRKREYASPTPAAGAAEPPLPPPRRRAPSYRSRKSKTAALGAEAAPGREREHAVAASAPRSRTSPPLLPSPSLTLSVNPLPRRTAGQLAGASWRSRPGSGVAAQAVPLARGLSAGASWQGGPLTLNKSHEEKTTAPQVQTRPGHASAAKARSHTSPPPAAQRPGGRRGQKGAAPLRSWAAAACPAHCASRIREGGSATQTSIWMSTAAFGTSSGLGRRGSCRARSPSPLTNMPSFRNSGPRSSDWATARRASPSR